MTRPTGDMPAPCVGTNCGITRYDQEHSPECVAEHAAAAAPAAQGEALTDRAPSAPGAIPQVVIDALNHAEHWIGSSGHGDNCFVSNHYEGDPGAGCNCGKDSVEWSIQLAAEAPGLDRNDDGVIVASQGEAPPPWVPATAAASDVLAERQRQVSGEGWTPEHDDEHSGGELAQAAATYAFPDIWNILGAHAWPFDGGPNLRGERENLVRAGALILAEIERLDRAAPRPADGACFC